MVQLPSLISAQGYIKTLDWVATKTLPIIKVFVLLTDVVQVLGKTVLVTESSHRMRLSPQPAPDNKQLLEIFL